MFNQNAASPFFTVIRFPVFGKHVAPPAYSNQSITNLEMNNFSYTIKEMGKVIIKIKKFFNSSWIGYLNVCKVDHYGSYTITWKYEQPSVFQMFWIGLNKKSIKHNQIIKIGQVLNYFISLLFVLHNWNWLIWNITNIL